MKDVNEEIPSGNDITSDQDVDEKMKKFQDTFGKLTSLKDKLYKDVQEVSSVETSALTSEEEPASREEMVKTLIDNFFDQITNQEVSSALEEIKVTQQSAMKAEVKGKED